MLRLRPFSFFLAAALAAGPLLAQTDKQVIGDPVITPNDVAADVSIIYLIRFQNTGSDTARNIVVRDTLDPKLNPETFVTLNTSNPYELLGEGGSVLRWYFKDINLPDSATGGANSVGYVLFSVQPSPFIAPGQTILNRACISFDDLSTVCTNETIVQVDDDADVDDPTLGKDLSWRVVPNPNHGQFEMQQVEKPVADDAVTEKYWITDMGGRTVWNGTAENTLAASNQIYLEKPVPGLYLLWVKSENRVHIERFTIVR